MTSRRSTHAKHTNTRSSARQTSPKREGNFGSEVFAGGKKNTRGGHVGNVGPLPTSSTASSPTRRSARTATSAKHRGKAGLSGNSLGEKQSHRSQHSGARAFQIPTPQGKMVISRRNFLLGALGVGAVAAVGGGAAAFAKSQEDAANSAVNPLTVPTASVTDHTTYALVDDPSTRLSLAGRFELPYGTLVWASDDEIAACLLPTAEAKPLVKVGLLSLSSGNVNTVLEKAVAQGEGFEIYDVRANSSGLVWIEADILDGIWRVYAATTDGSTMGTPHQVDEGNSEWETPSLAAVGPYAFWQVLPKPDGLSKAEDSLVKRVRFGNAESDTVYVSHGRCCTAPYALDSSVVVTPRADTAGTYYQLTRLDAASGDVLDTMVLPRSMKPLEAGYGNNGFMFSFDAWYTYGDGISQIGTYTPLSPVTDGNYSAAPWFHFTLTPTAPPSWCGKYCMVKSNRSVCGVDMGTGEYFALQPDNGADTYGEYLASTGMNDTVVTYANIDDKPVAGEAKKYCLVRHWRSLA